MVPLSTIEDAKVFDPTLKYPGNLKKRLEGKYLEPQSYSRKRLYDSMYAGKTIVFNNYPLFLTKKKNENTTDTLVRMLKQGLPLNESVYIRAGHSRSVYKVKINDTIERWLRQKSKFGVTDLHFRGTRFYDNVDAEAISYFNLLPHCPYEASFLEMLTLVISSKGIFTDSHSDDGDGSNHCFTGKKLWLAWDRIEGQRNGLQDCTYDNVYDQAKFSMHKFIALKSSHWFIVSDNQTLFMPGNFTHKVVTLEPYIGFGSFYVSIPNYFNTLKRWILYPTSDVKGNFLSILNTYSIQKIKPLASTSPSLKEKWGLPYFRKAAKRWEEGLTRTQVSLLTRNETFKEILSFSNSI